jgi:hypothetical protein
MRPIVRFLCTCLAAAVGLTHATGQSQTAFNFNGNLNAAYGTASLAFFNGATTQGAVSFGVTSAALGGFGIPNLPDNSAGDRTVMRTSAFTPSQGFLFSPNTAANGGGSRINQYSFGFDVLLADRTNYHSFYQTNPANNDDGDFFARPVGSGDGIGISGTYHGTVNVNTWYRIMVTVDMTTATMKKYIDGTLVGSQTLGAGVDGRWSLGTAAGSTIIFGDEDNESVQAYMSSFYFSNHILSDADVTTYGTVKTAGFLPVPEPVGMLAVCTAVAAIGIRSRRSVARR